MILFNNHFNNQQNCNCSVLSAKNKCIYIMKFNNINEDKGKQRFLQGFEGLGRSSLKKIFLIICIFHRLLLEES